MKKQNIETISESTQALEKTMASFFGCSFVFRCKCLLFEMNRPANQWVSIPTSHLPFARGAHAKDKQNKGGEETGSRLPSASVRCTTCLLILPHVDQESSHHNRTKERLQAIRRRGREKRLMAVFQSTRIFRASRSF